MRAGLPPCSHGEPSEMKGYLLKRPFDLLASACGLMLLAPLLTFLSLGVLLSLGRPVFFRQQRPGRNGHAFRLVKFRTMRDALDGEGQDLPDSERLTPFGIFLRRTSLDELPTLWNVFCGQMSLVGPRPLLMRYLPRYNSRQSRRHEVRPGVTGWAQINGRNALSWEEKFEYDIWYVDHASLGLDLRILFRTVFKVLRREDISADDHATMPEFLGTKE